MRSALRAESRRLLSRRITLVAVLLLLGMIVLFQLQVNSLVTPPTAAEIAQNQREYDDYVRDWDEHHEEWEADCVRSGGSQQECAEPRPELSEWGLAAEPFADVVTDALSFAVYLAGLVLFVAMASFIGAETTTGALANWLTFIPDRGTVMVSKLAVVAAFSALAGAGVTFVTVGFSSVVTALHGQPLTGLDHVLATAGRGVIVAVVFGVVGFCVGLLTGSTGASVGVLLGAIFAIYVRMALSFMSRWAERLAPWSPEVNLAAIIDGGTTYPVSSGPGAPSDSSSSYVEKPLGLVHGLGYWAVLLAALIAVTWLLFRRRDVV